MQPTTSDMDTLDRRLRDLAERVDHAREDIHVNDRSGWLSNLDTLATQANQLKGEVNEVAKMVWIEAESTTIVESLTAKLDELEAGYTRALHYFTTEAEHKRAS